MGRNYQLVIDNVILYFSFIKYQFVSTFSLPISNPLLFHCPMVNMRASQDGHHKLIIHFGVIQQT